MTAIPASLRIAFGFIAALWMVGLIALALGAPGEIVVATAAIGTVGAFVEWSTHRQREIDASVPGPVDATTTATVGANPEQITDPQPHFARKH
ncbi:hypothetical protein [Tardiphaga sp. 768_D3_N2_1]|uniref:hypothetical protein n=1 Tax=Tardiphaga sp. 768_D3_N2_1 TaxID=3240783 RepID=UPI003F890F2E